MAHYHAEIILAAKPADALVEVTRVLAPHRRRRGHPNGFWDWFQIGGRYTGRHVSSDFDPYADPRKVGVWPTQWEPLEADVMRITALPADLTCYTIIVESTGILHLGFEEGERGRLLAPVLAACGIRDGWAVTVDYHN
ncbi:MAG: hypothetical protein ACYDCP_07045 [Thermoplasmataceae archaeon]